MTRKMEKFSHFTRHLYTCNKSIKWADQKRLMAKSIQNIYFLIDHHSYLFINIQKKSLKALNNFSKKFLNCSTMVSSHIIFHFGDAETPA